MLRGVIMVLGAQNDDQGNLSVMGISRVEKAVELVKEYPDYGFVVTGAFGWNFNTTNIPHAEYLAKALCDRGIPEERIWAKILSRDTVQDIALAKQQLQNLDVREVILVTSDFHMRRVKMICHRIWGDAFRVQFVKANTELGWYRRLVYVVHEWVRMFQIKTRELL